MKRKQKKSALWHTVDFLLHIMVIGLLVNLFMPLLHADAVSFVAIIAVISAVLLLLEMIIEKLVKGR